MRTDEDEIRELRIIVKSQKAAIKQLQKDFNDISDKIKYIEARRVVRKK